MFSKKEQSLSSVGRELTKASLKLFNCWANVGLEGLLKLLHDPSQVLFVTVKRL